MCLNDNELTFDIEIRGRERERERQKEEKSTTNKNKSEWKREGKGGGRDKRWEGLINIIETCVCFRKEVLLIKRWSLSLSHLLLFIFFATITTIKKEVFFSLATLISFLIIIRFIQKKIYIYIKLKPFYVVAHALSQIQQQQKPKIKKKY